MIAIHSVDSVRLLAWLLPVLPMLATAVVALVALVLSTPRARVRPSPCSSVAALPWCAPRRSHDRVVIGQR